MYVIYKSKFLATIAKRVDLNWSKVAQEFIPLIGTTDTDIALVLLLITAHYGNMQQAYTSMMKQLLPTPTTYAVGYSYMPWILLIAVQDYPTLISNMDETIGACLSKLVPLRCPDLVLQGACYCAYLNVELVKRYFCNWITCLLHDKLLEKKMQYCIACALFIVTHNCSSDEWNDLLHSLPEQAMHRLQILQRETSMFEKIPQSYRDILIL